MAPTTRKRPAEPDGDAPALRRSARLRARVDESAAPATVTAPAPTPPRGNLPPQRSVRRQAQQQAVAAEPDPEPVEPATTRRSARLQARNVAAQRDDRVWWDTSVAARARQIWLPSNRDRSTHELPSTNPTAPGLSQDLMRHTSWFGLTNVTELPKNARRIPRERPAVEPQPAIGTIKVRLYPTSEERVRLNRLFGSHRAVYNKVVAMFNDHCRAVRERLRIRFFRLSKSELTRRYIGVVRRATLPQYISHHHLETPEDVRNAAFQDFLKAIYSSRKQYDKRREENANATVPELKFKSLRAASNSIQLRRRSLQLINYVDENDVHIESRLRFFPRYFGFAADDGIRIGNQIEAPEFDVRLQRKRNGHFFLCVTRYRDIDQTRSSRTCAIDPGVRVFATIYDPSGLTVGVRDADDRVFKRLLVIDRLISRRARAENKRLRYRLTKHITHSFQRVKDMVHDMHQKLTKWLSTHYHRVLLPSFETSNMSRRENRLSAKTTRKMLRMAHYRFKMLLAYKMERTGGEMVECNERYTTKTCSRCGTINHNITSQHVYRCPNRLCRLVMDRDVNAARNIFLKNERMLV